MNILVTGGAGFIASHVVDKLVAAGGSGTTGHHVAVLDNLTSGKRANVNQQAIFHHIDIRDPAVEDILASFGAEVVIHHAAQTEVSRSAANPALDADINIIGSINLLEACRRRGVRKVIYASSAAVYGTPQCLPIDETHVVAPLSGYGISKHTVEHYLAVYNSLYGLEYTVLRYANAYGIRQDPRVEGGVVSIFIDRLLQGKSCSIQGDGLQTRDFVYVTDIAEANVLALEACNGDTLNIGTGKAVSVRELYDTMAGMFSEVRPVEYVAARTGDIHDSCFDSHLARERLGWAPQVSLAEGLQLTVDYYRSRLI